MFERRLGAGMFGEDGGGDEAWQKARVQQMQAEAELRRN